jgi:hypothetical protein
MFNQITQRISGSMTQISQITTGAKTGINENNANSHTNDHITLSPLNLLISSFIYYLILKKYRLLLKDCEPLA